MGTYLAAALRAIWVHEGGGEEEKKMMMMIERKPNGRTDGGSVGGSRSPFGHWRRQRLLVARLEVTVWVVEKARRLGRASGEGEKEREIVVQGAAVAAATE